MSRRLLGSGAIVVLALGLAVYGGNQVLRVHHMRHDMETMERDVLALRTRAEALRTRSGHRGSAIRAWREKLTSLHAAEIP